MTPDLDRWLEQATRRLSKGSAAQVRTEIQEHYQSAREDAISGGASQDEANRMALIALGDAKTANKQYLRGSADGVREWNALQNLVAVGIVRHP